MAKTLNLEIRDFDLGIGPSPHRGFADMRNLDIYSRPGVIRINNRLEKVSGTTVTALIKWFIKNPTNADNIFAIDGSNKVYQSTDRGASWEHLSGNNGGNGQGGTIYRDYLFVTRFDTIDVYGPLSGSPSWTLSWKTIDSNIAYHPMVVSRNDGILYGGAGRYVFSIDEVSGQTFAPGNGATYTFTQHAADFVLPTGYVVKCMVELGEKMLLGTVFGANVFDFKIATIFPWDRSSITFDTPVELEENGINAMLTINNITFVLAGIEGKIFTTNGVQASEIAQIPRSVVNLEGGRYLEYHPGAIMNYQGRLFFGVGNNTTSGGIGVWSMKQTGRGNILNFEHSISTGSDGSSAGCEIGAILPMTRDTFIAGWRDDATFGIDKLDNSSRYTDYQAYVDSPLYNVGTNKNKKVYEQIEFLLAQALATGEGIRLAYRTDLSSSFTTIGTYTYADLGAVLSHNVIPGIPQSEFLQIRISLTTQSDSNTTPELLATLLN